VSLGLADVLVEQLGALDVQEERAALLAGALGDLLGQRVRDGLGDQRLAAAGRSVEQHALRRLQLVLEEQLRVQVGQLDRVADRLDLAAQATDRLVGDVRDLLEDQLLDLGLRDPLVDVAGAAVEQQRVAGAQGHVAQRLGEADDALLVGVGDHQHPVAVGQELLEHDDLADLLELEGGDHVEGLVEHDLLAALERVEIDRRTDVHAQLAAAGEHVDGVVLVAGQEGAEAGRRLSQPVDLLLEGHDLVAGLAQGLGEAFVLGGDGGERPLGLGEALLDRTGVHRALCEPATKLGDLVLEEAELAVQLFRRARARPVLTTL
jgi:hypothetical protein